MGFLGYYSSLDGSCAENSIELLSVPCPANTELIGFFGSDSWCLVRIPALGVPFLVNEVLKGVDTQFCLRKLVGSLLLGYCGFCEFSSIEIEVIWLLVPCPTGSESVVTDSFNDWCLVTGISLGKLLSVAVVLNIVVNWANSPNYVHTFKLGSDPVHKTTCVEIKMFLLSFPCPACSVSIISDFHDFWSFVTT